MNEREVEEVTLLIVVNLLEKIMATLDQVLAEVTSESTRLDSMNTLIQGLKKQINDALANQTLTPESQTKLDAIWGGLQDNKAKIDVALNTNVPAPSAAVASVPSVV